MAMVLNQRECKEGREGGREAREKEEPYIFSARDIFITLKFVSNPFLLLNSLTFQDKKKRFLNM